MKFRSIIVTLWLSLLPSVTTAAPSCAALAEAAAERHGIPPKLMAAISLVETQRAGRSWPWTLNEGGQSHYFETKQEALSYLTDAVARGVRNIDVGCMQLNFHWHAAGFSSLEAMLDPAKNTAYAALFLVELKKRLGSWEEATKHYHSADEARGNNYRDKVVQAAAQLDTSAAETFTGLASTESYQASDTQSAPIVEFAGLREDQLLALHRLVDQIVGPSGQSEPYAEMRDVSELPPRLRQRWDEVEAMREVLASSR